MSHQKLTASNYCPKRNKMHRKVIILWTTQWTFSWHTSLILGERGGRFSRRKIAFLALNSCPRNLLKSMKPFFSFSHAQQFKSNDELCRRLKLHLSSSPRWCQMNFLSTRVCYRSNEYPSQAKLPEYC